MCNSTDSTGGPLSNFEHCELVLSFAGRSSALAKFRVSAGGFLFADRFAFIIS